MGNPDVRSPVSSRSKPSSSSPSLVAVSCPLPALGADAEEEPGHKGLGQASAFPPTSGTKAG